VFLGNVFIMDNVLLKIKNILPKTVLDILRLAGSIGDYGQVPVFCAGGFVRDVLLMVNNLDIDLVVEGNGPGFAKELSDKLRGTLVLYKRFGTATVTTKDNLRIDVATARTEYYQSPGVLPRVSFSSMIDDLQRRDFTINAMAFSLNSESYGRLMDLFNGQRDLKNMIIRVLHDKSFIDDPTRIYRAIRFEQRYNFAISDDTERLIRDAVGLGMLEKIDGYRLKKEIELARSERLSSRVFARIKQLTGDRDVSQG